MALNTCEMWSNGIKIAFFSKKLQKIAQWLGLRSQTSVCDTFELQYTSLRKRVPHFRHFHILTIGLSSFLERVPSYVQTPSLGFWSSILRYLCPQKKFRFPSFWWRHCMSFVVWAPSNQKPGYAYECDTFWFFFKRVQSLQVTAFTNFSTEDKILATTELFWLQSIF